MVRANASSQGQLQLLGLGDALRGDIARPAQGQERMSLCCMGSGENFLMIKGAWSLSVPRAKPQADSHSVSWRANSTVLQQLSCKMDSLHRLGQPLGVSPHGMT